MTDSSAIAVDDKSTDDGQYAVSSSLEIGQILQSLARRAVLLKAELAGGDFFLTSIVAVDVAGGRMWIDTTPDRDEVDRVLRAARITFSGSLEKVQIRFACSGIEAGQYDGSPAFRAALPRTLSRLQRREHFRIQTPLVPPLKCVVTHSRDGQPAAVELVVADISCGGLSLIIGPGQFEPVPGEAYPCAIALPGATLRSAIELHHTHVIRSAQGKESLRSGFSFVNAPEALITAIQRYIMRLERERRARSV